jgi:tetratricopeptide (TPR) repeat protein
LGPVSVDRLRDDVAKLDLAEDQLRMASLPFPGRWMIGPARISLVPVFYQLLDHGFRDEAIDLMTRHADRFPLEVASAERVVQDGLKLLRQGDAAAAATRFTQATLLDATDAEAHFQLGQALDQLQQGAQAAEAYGRAIELDPEHAGAHFALARNRESAGAAAEAIAHLHDVLRIRPDHLPSLYHLARLLSTHPDSQLRNGAEALRLAERAVEITAGRQAEVLAVLAAARAETGAPADAEKLAEQALQLARSQGNLDVIRQLEQQLQAYRNRQPWRASE